MSSGSDVESQQLDFYQAMADFKSMFPDLDEEIIEAVLRANGGAVDGTIDQLLTMNYDTNCTSPVSANQAWPGDSQSQHNSAPYGISPARHSSSTARCAGSSVLHGGSPALLGGSPVLLGGSPALLEGSPAQHVTVSVSSTVNGGRPKRVCELGTSGNEVNLLYDAL